MAAGHADSGSVLAHTQALENRVTGLETSMVEVRREMRDNHNFLTAKLEDIASAVTRQGAQPTWRLNDVLGNAYSLLAIGALLAGSVIFIAHSLSAAPISALMEQRKADLQRIERTERLVERLFEIKVAGIK